MNNPQQLAILLANGIDEETAKQVLQELESVNQQNKTVRKQQAKDFSGWVRESLGEGYVRIRLELMALILQRLEIQPTASQIRESQLYPDTVTKELLKCIGVVTESKHFPQKDTNNKLTNLLAEFEGKDAESETNKGKDGGDDFFAAVTDALTKEEMAEIEPEEDYEELPETDDEEDDDDTEPVATVLVGIPEPAEFPPM